MNDIIYITPSTKVDICRGVPLPQNYEHVCSFGSEGATYSALSSYIKYSAVSTTPVKVPNAVRVNYGFNELTDCNYLIFSNYSSGNNRLYAFITNMRYININMTEIEYKIDVWTTNYAKMEFGRCFVEREHVSNDTFGQHTLPEGLETGTYINIGNDTCQYDMNNTCILYAPRKTDEVQSQIVNGVYSGLLMRIITTKSAPTIDAAIKEITENYSYPEVIQAIFHYPSFMGVEGVGNKITTVNRPSNLDGYVPKNNKCFTKEFCYCVADDLVGNTSEYAFEDSTLPAKNLQFRTCGTFITQPVINTYPLNYKGLTHCYNEGITTSNFPQCAWSSDSFASWYAQNRSLLAAQATGSMLNVLSGSIMGAVQGAAIGGPAGAVVGAATSAAVTSTSALTSAITRSAQIETKHRQPNQSHGQIMLDSLNIADNRMRIQFYTMSCRREIIEKIDNFFETFGYKVNTLKIPNITTRPAWNYVKTANAVINGNLFMNTTGDVENILNNGVTIWHNIASVGNYNLNNH